MTDSVIFRFPAASLSETSRLATALAGVLRPGDVIALGGTLGAGKTAFVRALVRALAGQEIDVPSPTFNLLLTYDFPDYCLYHYDLYRLESPEEALELDIDEAFDYGVSLIEWPDRLGRYLPAGHLRIDITVMEDSGSRLFELTGDESWRSRFMTLEEILGA
ncbi:MAG: tRNA (adenosine(37)-N6)-threonylcarbamoyltransferase complex ATPase subunit type 1 TsaE [Sneathiella sp.]|jgi:tRNA threonylcarbamoyladenosine biosynthesis protein TsaE|uniref:tRNA (adenosine(37)-N6)-threonylcarbamoyltransferase complex ATPase subunit type 1 TsaE n=1 Tax=Sneathiella sp. TaxID=1964365 RepID=UPI000C43FBE9|nr:tRNA (adenosine(37)-N6)-threonylcarbamoyltransferase complex ATPase subunit type 1 TsaE [Sneathiella sp.]MAL79198.1 tRNA (adenosine(37)-N6)-threonylcarbamoyltransferase complex ATPase subunit type 1 TsaE [Sneathiella sp.]|tara:strand:+ start:1115 stop:1600 length:486 start_codon:yes stop_codon:yes gene_type:complete